MTNELIMVAVVIVLIWLASFGIFGYWVKRRIDRVSQAANHAEPMNRPVTSNSAQQTARRRAAICMFIVLMIGVGLLVTALILSPSHLPKDDDFVRGHYPYRIAGAISAFLSLIGLIVKGLVDNLTRDESTQ